MSDTYRLAVIVASNREGRFAPTVARWFGAQAADRADIQQIDEIDLHDIDVPARLGAQGWEAMADFTRRIGEADGVVVITPEYNHSYPATLKQAIDFVRDEWYAKPIAFVSYGGVSGGLRAVEHLRGVFAELHATTIRESVSLHGYPNLFDDSGELHDAEPVNMAAKVLLDTLGWWALALKDARAARPYVA